MEEKPNLTENAGFMPTPRLAAILFTDPGAPGSVELP
jgi:hypothetical protein